MKRIIEINDRDIDLYTKARGHVDAWGGFGGYDKRDMDDAFKSLAKADKLSK